MRTTRDVLTHAQAYDRLVRAVTERDGAALKAILAEMEITDDGPMLPDLDQQELEL